MIIVSYHPSQIEITKAWIIPNLSISNNSYNPTKLQNHYQHLQGIEPPTVNPTDATLLIVADATVLIVVDAPHLLIDIKILKLGKITNRMQFVANLDGYLREVKKIIHQKQ